jgi:hypothetical protein
MSRFAIPSLGLATALVIVNFAGCDKPRADYDLAPKIVGTWEGPTNNLTLRAKIDPDGTATLAYHSNTIAFESRATWQTKGPILIFHRPDVPEPIECLVSFPGNNRMIWNQAGRRIMLERK